MITLALAALDLLLLLTDVRIRPNGYLIALTAAAIYGVCGHLNANSARSRPRIFSMPTGIAQMIMVVAVMTSMTYIAAAATFPLQDARLLAFDRAIGFDFRTFVAYVNARDWLIGILAAGYRAISWPILLNVVMLSLAGRYLQTGKFVLAFLIALLATTCVTVLVPAIGACGVASVVPSDYSNFEPQGYLDTVRDVPLLRDGNLRALDLFQPGGVVTFPAFMLPPRCFTRGPCGRSAGSDGSRCCRTRPCWSQLRSVADTSWRDRGHHRRWSINSRSMPDRLSTGADARSRSVSHELSKTRSARHGRANRRHGLRLPAAAPGNCVLQATRSLAAARARA